MSIAWLFNPTHDTQFAPRIGDQVTSITPTNLCLQNPWVSDSVFMGKIYTAMTAALALIIYPELLFTDTGRILSRDSELLALEILTPFLFTPFLAYRIYLIKNLSSIYFNRISKKIYYQRVKKLISFDWCNTRGGLFVRREFGGVSFSTSYALAFGPRREDGSLHLKDCFWIDSNEPTDFQTRYVAEVWEYLRHFMDHGPDKLPPPGEPNWWHKPLHAICLTPAEAWRHYAPWRTGEPGEMQGKRNWQLPFWAILFPYNLSVAICWYFICRLFNVRAAPAPTEAFEASPTLPGKVKRR